MLLDVEICDVERCPVPMLHHQQQAVTVREIMEYLAVYNDGSMPKQIYGNSGTATGGIYMYVDDKFFGYLICCLEIMTN